jgi:threonine dehydratase
MVWTPFRGCDPIDTPVDPAIVPSAIAEVHRRIVPHIRLTPILETRGSEFGLSPFPLTFKLEQLQFAGSFKVRGAFANLLSRPIPPAGVVAASGGNHGVAVAYAAMKVGVPARIFIPTVASPAKVERIRSYGAVLCVTGERYDEALAASEEWAAQSGALQVHAFNQPETILGQGTLALELARQSGPLDTLLVAVGGGGLIGGIAAWFRGATRVIGVEPSGAPTMSMALRAGEPVDAPAGGIAADSLAPKRVGAIVFPIAQAYVDRVILVEDQDIVHAQKTLWDAARIVAEPGGAAAFAALLAGAYRPAADERVGVVICGGNTNVVRFEDQAEKGPLPRP